MQNFQVQTFGKSIWGINSWNLREFFPTRSVITEIHPLFSSSCTLFRPSLKTLTLSRTISLLIMFCPYLSQIWRRISTAFMPLVQGKQITARICGILNRLESLLSEFSMGGILSGRDSKSAGFSIGRIPPFKYAQRNVNRIDYYHYDHCGLQTVVGTQYTSTGHRPHCCIGWISKQFSNRLRIL